jgi:Methyltransferase domain
MKRNLHNQMQAAFAKHGLLFGLSDAALNRRLRTLTANERFVDIQRVWDRLSEGKASLQVLYDYLETPEQLHAVLSLNSKNSLDANAFLYSTLSTYLKPQSRLADLGCATGAMVSWISSQHPDCAVVGIDCNPLAIRFAKQLVTAENAEFLQFDYSQGLPPPVEPCDALICSFGIAPRQPNVRESYALDPHDLRSCEYYRVSHQSYLRHFTSWRHMAKADAPLLVTFRCTSGEGCLAFVHAAHEAGWASRWQSPV